MSNLVKTHIDRSRESFVYNSGTLGNGQELLFVEMAGVTLPDKDYAIRRTRSSPRRFENMYVIEYVVSGAGYIESEGKRARVEAGDLYIIHRRTVHSYYADKQKPFCKKWINVAGRFLNAMEDVFFSDGPFTVVRLGERAEKVMDDIHAILSEAQTDITAVSATVMKKLLDLFLLIEEQKKAELGEMTLFEQICEYIDRNIFSGLSVSGITDKFFISSSTLYRTFRSKIGISPKEYIVRAKIEAAKRMIGANDTTFNTIASSLGFYDSHHFFRTFRAQTGMSPSEYRKKLLLEEEV